MPSIKDPLNDELNINSFELEFDDKENGIIALTTENVQKVETMLRYNPDYPQFIDLKNLNKETKFEGYLDEKYKEELGKHLKDNNTKVEDLIEIYKKYNDIKNIKYEYSSVYYIKALKKYKTHEDNKYMYPYLILLILRKINSENSTRVSLNDIGKIACKIVDKYSDYDKLADALKEPSKNSEECNYELIKIFCEGLQKRYLSLATKFCHYVSFVLFYDTDDKDDCDAKYADLYSIYDEVVNSSLKKYTDKYNIEFEKKELTNLKDWDEILDYYRKYQEVIKKVIESYGKGSKIISRNGFDHLIWYSNKKG